MWVISVVPLFAALLSLPPVYAALDMTPFATLAASALSGGLVYAVTQYKRTPAEVESISVATLSTALSQLRIDLDRKEKEAEAKDKIIHDCHDRLDEMQERIDELKGSQHG